MRSRACPGQRHPAAGFERCVDGVTQQIDEDLLELIAVALNLHLRAGSYYWRQALLQARDLANPDACTHWRQVRPWQSGQTRVSTHEAAQTLAARSNNRQATNGVVAPVVRQGFAPDHRFQAPGDGLDGRQ